MIVIFLLSLSSFVLSLSITALLKNYLSKNLLDIPNQRSSHLRPTPRGGGLGFILAFAIACILLYLFRNYLSPYFSSQLSPDRIAYLWLVLTPLAVIGFIDDKQDISAKVRYLIQLTVAGLTILFFGTVPLPGIEQYGSIGTIIAIAVSLIAITANINFYNFMDGLDGLVASVTALQLAFIAFYLQQPLFFLLVAALIGFLYWNWSPAKIFMGDIGSTVLGASLAIALIGGKQDTIMAWSALTVTFPLIGDSIYTLIRRLIKQENIFQPHRTHIYQRLQQSGFSHREVAITYLLITIIFVGVVYWLGVFSIGINSILTLSAIAVAETYFAFQSVDRKLS